MDTRQYLGKIAQYKRRIDMKRKDLDEYRALKSVASGIDYDERVQTSKKNDQMPNVVIKILEKEAEINELIGLYINCRESMITQIEKCNAINDNERTVLLYRYVHCLTQTDTAEIMNYSDRRIQDIEYKAIDKFGKYLEKNPKFVKECV